MSLDDLKNFIYAFFENRQMRLTPCDLERMLRRRQPGFSLKSVRSVIRDMVAEGALLYTNHFNTTHLELNFCRPVRVSERIVLSPPGHVLEDTSSDALIIRMHSGSAFGMGDHPTTRLVLRAMDTLMTEVMAEGSQGGIRALDIGTGSGVLAMAAVKLGAESVMALDIDQLALHEAHNNFCLNELDQLIALTDDVLESLAGKTFDLIMANLRPPTIKQILPQVAALSSINSHWIFSGFREEALEDVVQILPRESTEILARQASCGWAALTVKYSHYPQRGQGA